MSIDDIGKKIGNTIIEHSQDAVFTLYSNNVLCADNFERIDYLSENIIKIKTDAGVLIITGKNLLFDSICQDTAKIIGKITSVEIEGADYERE